MAGSKTKTSLRGRDAETGEFTTVKEARKNSYVLSIWLLKGFFLKKGLI